MFVVGAVHDRKEQSCECNCEGATTCRDREQDRSEDEEEQEEMRSVVRDDDALGRRDLIKVRLLPLHH